MQKRLQTAFSTRQYMLSKDFEIYYYSDSNLSKVESHMHDYYEFYFFLSGDISMEIDHTPYKLQSGDMILIPPGILHRALIHSQEEPYNRFVFWISPEYYQHLCKISPDFDYLFYLTRSQQTYVFHLDQLTFNSTRSQILTLIEEQRTRRFGREIQISICVNGLMLFLNRAIYEQHNPRRQEDENSLYQKLTIYIEQHLEENLSLDSLAREFYVNKYHIAHVFKEHTGLSLHQYITKKRLAACKDAILGNTSITDVYQAMGFGDYSSFYRAFKKEFGVSPKEYRDLHIL